MSKKNTIHVLDYLFAIAIIEYISPSLSFYTYI